MTKDQLRDLFQSPFNYERFCDICADFLRISKDVFAPKLGGNATFTCSEPGTTAYYVGRVDLGFERLGLVVYDLSSKTTLTRPIGLRNLAIGLTKYHFDAVLAVFKGKDDWRFSYIDGVKDENKLAPRRYSYVFGYPGERYRTPIDNFEALKDALKEKPTLAKYKDAFSVEALGDRFFKKYKSIYEDFVQEITGQRYEQRKGKWEDVKKGDPSPLFATSFQGDAKRVRDYVKKMMGRLVFLQFLQKKGWMGVPAGKPYTTRTGERRYLQRLFEQSPHKDNFLDAVLEPLFFQTLNADRRPEDLIDPALWLNPDCPIRIPFLSGSLFEADEDDNRPCHFSANRFRDLFDLFDQFNFTIDEADPSDAEVGVAPEMLGRIFENLLEDNKDKGAFYTPREVVQYMCQEALIAYLRQATRSDTRLIETLVRHHTFPETESRELRLAFRDALENVRICDPAIGSGAFPMGMLHELLACHKALACEKGATAEERREAFTQFKRHIIQNNIYGVDIEQGAVDIARLRFWLALVVDEREPHPLVNLDYKILRGDSLCAMYNGNPVSLKASYGTQNRVDAKLKTFHLHAKAYMAAEDTHTRVAERKAANLALLDTLEAYYTHQTTLSDETRNYRQDTFAFGQAPDQEELRGAVVVPTDNASRKMLAHVKTLRAEIEAGNNVAVPFFDWAISYADVMAQGGFDIVIGNPPYIHFEKEKALGLRYKTSTPLTYTPRGDIYCSFYEKGFTLLKDGGHLCYITSNKWMRAAYGEPLRTFLAKNANIRHLLDFAGTQIFDSATVDTNILLAQKKTANNLPKTPTTLSQACLAQAPKPTLLTDLPAYVKAHAFPQAFPSDGAAWAILTPIEQSIKAKIERYGTPLKDWDVEINYGIKTGLNEAFIIDGATKDRLIAQDPKSAEIIRPILRGRDIKRYAYTFADKWLIATFPALHLNIDDYPAVRDYLLTFDKRVLAQTGEKNIDGIKGKNARKKTGNKWFETQDQIAYWSLFSQPKIMWGEISDIPKFAYDGEGFYPEATTFLMSGQHLEYLAFYLNSSLAEFLFSSQGTTTGVGTLRWKKYTLQMLRVPLPTENITHLAREHITNPVTGSSIVMAAAYTLLDLTDEECQYINAWQKKQKN